MLVLDAVNDVLLTLKIVFVALLRKLSAVFAVFFIYGGFPSFLHAEAVNAAPLTGPGEYEFLFFTADKKPELEALTARFRELDPELSNLHAELKKIEGEIATLGSKAPGKKKQNLEMVAD